MAAKTLFVLNQVTGRMRYAAAGDTATLPCQLAVAASVADFLVKVTNSDGTASCGGVWSSLVAVGAGKAFYADGSGAVVGYDAVVEAAPAFRGTNVSASVDCLNVANASGPHAIFGTTAGGVRVLNQAIRMFNASASFYTAIVNTDATANRTITLPDATGTVLLSTGLANPTATVGLTAVNGSATTPMRSDGAPALDVGIVPTWTGAHTFSSTVAFNGNITTGNASTDTNTHNARLSLPNATTTGNALSIGGDTDLYRASAGLLRTSGSFTVDGNTVMSGNVTLGDASGDVLTANGRLSLPNATSSGNSLSIGGDVDLYRGAANVLYTPDSVWIRAATLSVGVSGTSVGTIDGGGLDSLLFAITASGYSSGPNFVNTTGNTGSAAIAGDGVNIRWWSKGRPSPTNAALPTNYEACQLYMAGGDFVIQTLAAGTGTLRNIGLVPATQVNITGALSASTHIRSTGPTSGIGYATGAGGTVTQATSKSTGVTLNNVCGTITMNGAALAGDTTVSFTLTNSAIAATDVLIIQHDSVATLGSYTVSANTMGAGSCQITVRNITTGSLSQAIVLRFAVVKAVAS